MACNECNQEQDFSASNIQKNGCPQEIPGDCLYYSGNAIAGIANPGDTLNAVIRKIAIKLGAIVTDVNDLGEEVALLSGETPITTSTTTTTTTAPTTTTTTSTSSTTTSTTTGTSTSSTTTSTTTAAPGSTSNVYVFSGSTGATPSESEILAGNVSVQNETADVLVNLTPFNSAPAYSKVAIKINGAGSDKNRWVYQTNPTTLNTIGGSEDVFAAGVTVNVSGVPYRVYITQYATQFAENIIFKHV